MANSVCMVQFIRVLGFSWAVLSVLATAADPVSYGGTRLPGYEKSLSQVYPEAKSFKEIVVTQQELGGTTFAGLVSRLLGERPNKTYEGIATPRVIYEVYQDKKMVGLAHGTSIEVPAGLASVFVFYNLDGSIKNLRVDGVPEPIMKQLHEGNYIQQFVGHHVEDFEKQARYKGRRGRRQSYWAKGKFLVEARAPSSGQLGVYWNKILRSVRFNAAFMDVVLITRHPELDRHERISNVAVSGPEKEVEGARVVSPEDNQTMIIKAAPKPIGADPANN